MSTPRPQFSRVPENIDVALLQRTLVVVVGVGMVGSQIAEGLTRFAVGRLRLIDHEPYEVENTLRHALPVEYVGRNKAAALADWLPEQISGLQVEMITRKVDISVSDDELGRWFADADLIVAATDDREAQRRIGRWSLVNEIMAVFPAIYPHRGGGEVILQLGAEWPCFGCWDYFRPDVEALRGANALDLEAQPVIFHAEQLCLGALDPGSRQHELLQGERTGDPPHQLVMIDRAGIPSFSSLLRRPHCPSCADIITSPTLQPEITGPRRPPVRPLITVTTSSTAANAGNVVTEILGGLAGAVLAVVEDLFKVWLGLWFIVLACGAVVAVAYGSYWLLTKLF